MEFGVAAFSVLAGFVVSKLGVLIEKKLKSDPDIRANVRIIKEDLEAIKTFVEVRGPNGEHPLWIAQLRRLAYDIEDCIDCFDADKMNLKDFAREIDALTKILSATTQRMQNFRFPAEVADVVPIPIELQNLGDYNLNCLLYLCLFPPNHDVRTKPLIRRWLAEGLVQREQLAVDNLKVLTSSSIINSMSIQRSNNGKVKRCQPTNEVLQYISRRSISENFVLFCDGEAQLLEAQAARRLSVHPPAIGELNLPQDLSRLRTLAVFHAGATSIDGYETLLDFSRYEMLRVLDLKECAHLSEVRLRDIWDQVLMKYLSINLDSIDSIPRDIRHLEQLETLDLSGSKSVMVSKEVLLLPKLKHLLGKFELCKSDTFSRNVPSDVAKFLKAKSMLETLAGFITGERLGFPQLMTLMRRLQKVKIWCQSDACGRNLVDTSSAIAKFIRDGTDEPHRGRSLSIVFQECSGQFLNIIDPDAVHGVLASLKLRGNLSQFPQFFAQLSAIEELCLWSTGLGWVDIRAGLRTVTGLKYLKLIEDNLESLDILSEAEHLKAIERIYVVSKKKLKVSITVTQLVSVHILCQDLHVIPDKHLIEITRMARLKEVALHIQVADTLKEGLRRAVDGRTNRVEVSFLEYPL